MRLSELLEKQHIHKRNGWFINRDQMVFMVTIEAGNLATMLASRITNETKLITEEWLNVPQAKPFEREMILSKLTDILPILLTIGIDQEQLDIARASEDIVIQWEENYEEAWNKEAKYLDPVSLALADVVGFSGREFCNDTIACLVEVVRGLGFSRQEFEFTYLKKHHELSNFTQ